MDAMSMARLNFFGYDDVKASIECDMTPILRLLTKPEDFAFITDWDNYKKYACNSDAIIAKTKELYEKHDLKLHNIYATTQKEYSDFLESFDSQQANCTKSSMTPSVIREFYRQLATKVQCISPFDLPIYRTNMGAPLEGGTRKEAVVYPDSPLLKGVKKIITFTGIGLDQHCSLAQIPIYAHEIAHTQTESRPGYTKNLVNAEVISTFIEKAFALDLDPTYELLKTVERGRLYAGARYFCDINPGKHITSAKFSSREAALEIAHFLGCIIGTKLFDMYQNETVERKRLRYFRDIQAVFDGEMTIETMLAKRSIMLGKCLDIAMLSRHV